MKHESISKATCVESQNVCSSLSCNCVERLTQKTTHTHKVWNDSHFRLISSPIFQSLPLLLPVNLEILTYELTSFLRQYDVFSFCVKREYSASMTQKRVLDWTLQGLTPLAKINRGNVCVTDISKFLLTQKAKTSRNVFYPKTNNQEINQFWIRSGHWIESLKTHLYRVSCTLAWISSFESLLLPQ